jgi:GntR family transcriptional regulator, transcriptional repressor for pyruvate dehydrogenase complex
MATGTDEVDGYRPGYEVAAERILELIAELGLTPGDRMPTEADLAARLSLSRSVVREAVKILSALGRVRAHKGRGLYVADDVAMLGLQQGPVFLPTDLSHVYRLFEFRRILEVEASQLAAERATPPQLRAMRIAADGCHQALLDDDFAGFAAADDAFHQAVAAGSDNPFLEASIVQARRAQRQTVRLGMPKQIAPEFANAVEDHDQIFEAIRAADPAAAAKAAQRHVERTSADYRAEIERRLAGSRA